MSTPPQGRRPLLNTLAIGVGLVAVVLVTISFFAGDATALRISALVLIIGAIALSRIARRQPPPPTAPD